jgi:YVTN family beta-propeller protein
MKPRTCRLLVVAAFPLAGVLGSAASLAQNAYVTNFLSNTVSMINTTTNTPVIGSPMTVGRNLLGVAVAPNGSEVYVANAD